MPFYDYHTHFFNIYIFSPSQTVFGEASVSMYVPHNRMSFYILLIFRKK